MTVLFGGLGGFCCVLGVLRGLFCFVFWSFFTWTPYLYFNKIEDLFPAFDTYREKRQVSHWLKKTFKHILNSLLLWKHWDILKHFSNLDSNSSLLLLHWWKSWNWWKVQIFMVRSRRFLFPTFKLTVLSKLVTFCLRSYGRSCFM